MPSTMLRVRKPRVVDVLKMYGGISVFGHGNTSSAFGAIPSEGVSLHAHTNGLYMPAARHALRRVHDNWGSTSSAKMYGESCVFGHGNMSIAGAEKSLAVIALYTMTMPLHLAALSLSQWCPN